MLEEIEIDDQPISSTFFDEGKWLTEFVTPENLEVQNLYEEITKGIYDVKEKVIACWDWVASQVKYSNFIKGKLWVNGRSDVQQDLWLDPGMVIRTKVGNCANKAFLLCSLLRNEIPVDQVHVVLGNLYNGKPGGHAWVQYNDYIIESTRADVPPLVPVNAADRYEAVHLFNDKEVSTIKGRTVMTPFTRCYSEWLVDYLDRAYIEGRK